MSLWYLDGISSTECCDQLCEGNQLWLVSMYVHCVHLLFILLS